MQSCMVLVKSLEQRRRVRELSWRPQDEGEFWRIFPFSMRLQSDNVLAGCSSSSQPAISSFFNSLGNGESEHPGIMNVFPGRRRAVQVLIHESMFYKNPGACTLQCLVEARVVPVGRTMVKPSIHVHTVVSRERIGRIGFSRDSECLVREHCD